MARRFVRRVKGKGSADEETLVSKQRRDTQEQRDKTPQAESASTAAVPVQTSGTATLLNNRHLASQVNAPLRAQLMLGLQETHGNAYVQRMVHSMQVQRRGGSAPAKEDDTATRIKQAKGSGATLESGMQRKLEGAMGTGLDGVRIHTDSEADHLARSVNAEAFTTDKDIFFRSGRYNPQSSEGLELLSHEVAHTVQQGVGPVSGKSAGSLQVSQPGDPHEREADETAAQVVQQIQQGKGMYESVGKGTGAVGAGTAVQREVAPKEEEEPVQRKLSRKASTGAVIDVQREAAPKEEEEQPVQRKGSATVQRAAAADTKTAEDEPGSVEASNKEEDGQVLAEKAREQIQTQIDKIQDEFPGVGVSVRTLFKQTVLGGPLVFVSIGLKAGRTEGEARAKWDVEEMGMKFAGVEKWVSRYEWVAPKESGSIENGGASGQITEGGPQKAAPEAPKPPANQTAEGVTAEQTQDPGAAAQVEEAKNAADMAPPEDENEAMTNQAEDAAKKEEEA